MLCFHPWVPTIEELICYALNHPLGLSLLQSLALDVVKHDALTAHLACRGAKCCERDVTLGACVKDWRGPAFQLVKFCTFGKHFFVLYIF